MVTPFAFLMPFFILKRERKEGEMNISTFYQHSRCEKISAMQNLIHEESRYSALDQVIRSALASLGAGVHPDTICLQMYKSLKEKYSQLEQSFFWKAEGDAKNDALRFNRFLRWFQQSGMTICKVFQSVMVETPTSLPDGSFDLRGKVDLICSRMEEEREIYYGFIFHSGQARKGLRGKSLSTNIATDLHPLVAKLHLEEKYFNLL